MPATATVTMKIERAYVLFTADDWTLGVLHVDVSIMHRPSIHRIWGTVKIG